MKPTIKAYRQTSFHIFFTLFFLSFYGEMHAQSGFITGSRDICQGDTATLTVNGNFTTYVWSNGAITPSIRVSASGIYKVTATDSRAIATLDSIIVTVHALPNPVIEGTPFVCFGRSTTLVVRGTFRSIQWSSGERVNDITVYATRDYSVDVVDTFGCRGSARVMVRDGSQAYNSLPDTVKICAGDSLTLDATTPFAKSYYWNTDDTTATLTVRDSGRYNVIVSTGQCVNYDTIRVFVLPPPRVNLGADTSFCKGDTLILRAETSPLYSYKWNDGSTNPTLKVFKEGIYGVEVMFGQCRASDSTDIFFYNKEAGKIVEAISCTPQFLIEPNLRHTKTYKWSTGSNNASIIVSKSSSYQVIMSNGKCAVSWFYNLQFKKKPIVNLGKDTLICQDIKKGSLLLKGGEQGVANYIWQDSSNNPTFEVKGSGTYSVYAENECGNAQDDITVFMQNCYEIYVPTAFSPNNDGQNETLQVFPTANIKKILRFDIYDRWGNMVYNATNFMQDEAQKFAWDGRFKGKPLQPNVFVYMLEYETTDGHKLVQKGDVTLVK
jgi:gliding motility-associated-like protein